MFRNIIKPPHLNPGDTVAIVSCSWGGPHAVPKRFEDGKRRLKDVFGLQVIEMEHTRSSAEFLAAHPDARAADLMNAFKNPKVKGIIASIGGNDAIKILPYIDYQVIKDNPKVVMGYSDFSVVHFMCFKAGLSSFYGPVVMCEFAENISMSNYLVESMQKTLFTSEPIGEIKPSHAWTNEFLDWNASINQLKSRSYKENTNQEWSFLQGSGEISGHLIGGCLDVIDPFIRETDLWLDDNAWKDSILFLEISEDGWSPQQVKEALHRMSEKGVFSQIRGILFGRPAGSKAWSKDFEAFDKAILEVCAERNRKDIAVITRMDFGHTSPVFVIPYGDVITIDCAAKKIYLRESACTPREQLEQKKDEKHVQKQVAHDTQFRLKLDSTLRTKPIFHSSSTFWHQSVAKEHFVDILDRNFSSNEERKKYLFSLVSRMASSADESNKANIDLLFHALNSITLTRQDAALLHEIAIFAEKTGNVSYANELKTFADVATSSHVNANLQSNVK